MDYLTKIIARSNPEVQGRRFAADKTVVRMRNMPVFYGTKSSLGPAT